MQCNDSYVYSGFNLQVNVSALLLETSRQFNMRYTANLVPNTAHILQFTLCELWSRPYTMKWQHRIFSLQYSTEHICATIGDTSTIQCSFYCKFGVKYNAHRPVYSMWTVVPYIYKIFTAPHIQATKFSWTYLRCNWRYLYNSMRVIVQTWIQIKRTSSRLYYVYCGPGHIQYIYSSSYSGHNIQLNVSALLLEISRQFNERYAANFVPNIAHIIQFTLWELWSRTYTM
jgi:hypothetical protein